jgi:hypothetical protein
VTAAIQTTAPHRKHSPSHGGGWGEASLNNKHNNYTAMKLKKLLLLICLLAASAMSVFAQDNEFWFVAPDVAFNHNDRPVMFVFTNPNGTAADVTLTISGGNPLNSAVYNVTHTVGPNSSEHVDFTSASPLYNSGTGSHKWENSRYSAGQRANFGIHIKSTQNILAYYML